MTAAKIEVDRQALETVLDCFFEDQYADYTTAADGEAKECHVIHSLQTLVVDLRNADQAAKESEVLEL